jgi:hypothetical protein
MRRTVITLVFRVADALNWLGMEWLACEWLNGRYSPGQYLLRFGFHTNDYRHGYNRFRWDGEKNTIERIP